MPKIEWKKLSTIIKNIIMNYKQRFKDKISFIITIADFITKIATIKITSVP